MSDEPSIACPTCGRRSWHPKDVEHQWCAACQRFHCSMFYRTMFTIVTVEPLTFICRMIAPSIDGPEDDASDYIFTPESHGPMPVDSLPGDICTGYMNVNAAHIHDRYDGIIIHTIERQFREGEVPTWEELIEDGTVTQ